LGATCIKAAHKYVDEIATWCHYKAEMQLEKAAQSTFIQKIAHKMLMKLTQG